MAPHIYFIFPKTGWVCIIFGDRISDLVLGDGTKIKVPEKSGEIIPYEGADPIKVIVFDDENLSPFDLSTGHEDLKRQVAEYVKGLDNASPHRP